MEKDMKKPFFSRFLESQRQEHTEGIKGGNQLLTQKFPSDVDEPVTQKWPSDNDEGGPNF